MVPNRQEYGKIVRAIEPVLQRYHVRRSGLFGSVVKGKMTDGSDIDILVELDQEYSLLDFVELKQELEDALGRPVDLVEYQTIKEPLKEKILREEVRVYDAEN